MANITAAREMPLEGMPDAPDEEWVKAWLQQQNGFGRQVGAAFQRAITIGENTTSLVKEIDLVHGQSVTVANPLSVPIQGIFAIGCRGLTVGSDGKPNGGVYDLAIPDLQAKPSTSGDGSWVVQANYAFMPSETVGVPGEVVGPISRVRSNAVSMTSGSVTNIPTPSASFTLTPGEYLVQGQVGFLPAGTTTVTIYAAAISTTSAVFPGTDTQAVPTSGEVAVQSTGAGVAPGSNFLSVAIPPYRVAVADGTTKTLFLLGRISFATSTLTAFGSMEAVRTKPYLTGRTGKVKLFFFGG